MSATAMIIGSAVIAASTFGVAAAGDRIREPFRDPHGPLDVDSMLTVHRALGRVNRLDLDDDADQGTAARLLTDVRTFLRDQVDAGPRRHRAERAELLADVDARLIALGVQPEPWPAGGRWSSLLQQATGRNLTVTGGQLSPEGTTLTLEATEKDRENYAAAVRAVRDGAHVAQEVVRNGAVVWHRDEAAE